MHMRKMMSGLVVLVCLATTSAFADTAADYAKNCKVCHGADGKGKFAIDFAKTDAEMTKALDEGTASKDGKVKMKSFKDKVDVKAMVEYVKTLKK
jgi:mono/diheme cytochrome c family protein